jgi:hypothetical protein
MSEQQFTNNALTTLGSALGSTATTVTLAAGSGALFPTLEPGQFFLGTLWSAGSSTQVPNEIVTATARTGDTVTIVRAQEGTTAQAWAVGDNFQLLVTAGTLSEFAQQGDVQAQVGNWAQDTGAVNAGAVTLTPAPATMTGLKGAPVRVLKTGTNTAAYSLNVNGLGATAVQFQGEPLIAGDLIAGLWFEVIYDGVVFQLQNPPGVPVGGPPTGGAGGDLSGSYPNPVIASNAVTNAKAAQMAAGTVKANPTGATANAEDVPFPTFLGNLGFAATFGATGNLQLPISAGVIACLQWGPYSIGADGGTDPVTFSPAFAAEPVTWVNVNNAASEMIGTTSVTAAGMTVLGGSLDPDGRTGTWFALGPLT